MLKLGSKVIFPTLAGILAVLSLSACNGVGDWSVSGLPGGYEVWRINSETIELCLPDEEHPFLADSVVSTYVFELAYNDAFICAKRADVPEGRNLKIDTSDPDHYIVDVNDRTCHGPFDEDGFYEAWQELGNGEELEWMSLSALRKRLGTR